MREQDRGDEASPDVIAAVDSAMQDWRQGDVTEPSVFYQFADVRRPTTALSVEAAKRASSGAARVRITTPVDGLVVLTQTCDVVRSCTSRPHVEVCPLVQEDSVVASAAARGERPRYAALPHLGNTAVADLDRIMTVEKGYLSLLTRRPGWDSDEQIRRFQAAVARRYQRFAFPDDFVRSVKKLTDKIRSKYGNPLSAEGSLFSRVAQIRVHAFPHWDSTKIEATLVFVLEPGTLAPLPEELAETTRSAATRQWLRGPRSATEIAARLDSESDPAAQNILWTRLAEAWASVATPVGVVTAVYAEVADANEYSMTRFWSSSQLDLDHLSLAEAS
jgi:hypothetical protein